MEHPVKRIVRPETGGTGQVKKYPQVGETLSSGYTVIANYHNRHVLAHNELAPQPYAIWDLDQDGDTVTGRYFCEVSRAEKRFAEICFPWFDEPLCEREAIRLRNLLWELDEAVEADELKTLIDRCGVPGSIEIDKGEPVSFDQQTEVRIVFGYPFPEYFEVFVNGRQLEDLKHFSLEAGEKRIPTYKCEKYLPVPNAYQMHLTPKESLGYRLEPATENKKYAQLERQLQAMQKDVSRCVSVLDEMEQVNRLLENDIPDGISQ